MGTTCSSHGTGLIGVRKLVLLKRHASTMRGRCSCELPGLLVFGAEAARRHNPTFGTNHPLTHILEGHVQHVFQRRSTPNQNLLGMLLFTSKVDYLDQPTHFLFKTLAETCGSIKRT